MPSREIPKKIEHCLSIVGLLEEKDTLVKKFSKGMKQRLGIADVLIKDPEIVIFDEPTEGLDLEVANQILNTIKELNQKNKITFLISSHQLNLVQKICDKVGIMSNGKLITEGNVEELGKNILGGNKYQIELEVVGDSQKVIEKLKQIKGIKSTSLKDDTILIGTDEDLRKEISKVVSSIDDVILTKIDIKDFSLEDIYLNYFKEV